MMSARCNTRPEYMIVSLQRTQKDRICLVEIFRDLQVDIHYQHAFEITACFETHVY